MRKIIEEKKRESEGDRLRNFGGRRDRMQKSQGNAEILGEDGRRREREGKVEMKKKSRKGTEFREKI